MPLYDVKNTKTNEVTEVMMSYDRLQEYLKDNPNMVHEMHLGKTRNADAERKGFYKDEFSGHLEKIQKFYTTRSAKSTIAPW